MGWNRHIRRLTASFAAVAVLASGVALPLADAGAATGYPSVEAEHQPERCHLAHDHMACVQHASSAPLTEPLGDDPLADPLRVRRLDPLPDSPVASRSTSLLPRPRAPPSLG